MPSEKYVNNAVTTLNGAINNTTTTVVVTSAATFPTAGNFRIAVEGEAMLVTAVASNTFTVTRGIEGTAAVSHSTGIAVTHVLTKGALDAILADNCQYGTCANRPAAERAGRLYFGSDFPMVYRDTGSAWEGYYRGSRCNPPITANYTWTHGGGTATNTDITNGPSRISVTANAGGDRISKLVRSMGSTPWSFISRVCSLQQNPNTTFSGICVSDGTKLECLGIIFEGNVPRLWTGRYNSLTNFAGEAFNRMEPPANFADMWLKITDDGTNRSAGYSNDGVNYNTIWGASRTTFLTATQGGVYVGTNAATGVPCSMLWISDGI